MLRVPQSWFGVLGLLTLACAEKPEPQVAPRPVEGKTASPPATAPGAVRRVALQETVRNGLGAFLAHVELSDEPVFRRGEFYGFRIARLVEPRAWEGIDVRAGDVVSRINGMPIEKPDQAYAAFKALVNAKEIVVDLERAGEARTVRVPIVD
jgi:type II secretory pathway component PulC